jgi:hypothetical protein
VKDRIYSDQFCSLGLVKCPHRLDLTKSNPNPIKNKSTIEWYYCGLYNVELFTADSDATKFYRCPKCLKGVNF